MRKMFSGEDTAFPTKNTLVQAEVQTPPGFELYQACQVHVQSLHSSSPHKTWSTPPLSPLRQVAFQEGVIEPRVTVTLAFMALAHVSGLSHHPFQTLVTLRPTQSCLVPSSGFPFLCGSSLPNRDDVCSFICLLFWGLDPRPRTCKASTLPLSHTSVPFS